MSPGPIQLDQATALTLMLGPNGSVGIQASGHSCLRCLLLVMGDVLRFLSKKNDVWFTQAQTRPRHGDRKGEPYIMGKVLPSQRLLKQFGCLRCLLLVMCTYPFAKKALTLYLARTRRSRALFWL